MVVEPLNDWFPDHPPPAIQLVALDDVHVSVIEPPENIVDKFELKLTTGAAGVGVFVPPLLVPPFELCPLLFDVPLLPVVDVDLEFKTDEGLDSIDTDTCL